MRIENELSSEVTNVRRLDRVRIIRLVLRATELEAPFELVPQHTRIPFLTSSFGWARKCWTTSRFNSGYYCFFSGLVENEVSLYKQESLPFEELKTANGKQDSISLKRA